MTSHGFKSTALILQLFLMIFLSILLSILLSACGTDEGYEVADLTARPQVADLQFVNLIKDSPVLDISLDTLSGALDFGGASAVTGLLIGDEYTLSVSYLDADGETLTLLETDDISYVDEDQYVYLYSGTIANPVVNAQRFLDPQYASEIAAGQLEVWFSYTAASPVEIDIYLTGPNVALEAAFPDVSLASSGISNVLTINAEDEYRLRVTPRNNFEVLFDSGSFTLAPQSRVLFAVTDYFGPKDTGNELDAILVNSSGSTRFAERDLPSQVRVINLIRDTGPIDLYLGSTDLSPLAANIGLTEISDYRDVEPGDLSLNLTLPGVKSEFLLQEDLSVGLGTYYSIVLSGSLAQDTINATLIESNTRPTHGRVALNFMNATEEQNSIDVYFLNPGQVIEDRAPQIEFLAKDSNTSLVVTSGLFDIIVTSADGANIIYGPDRVLLSPEKNYSLVLVEDLINQATAPKLIILED